MLTALLLIFTAAVTSTATAASDCQGVSGVSTNVQVAWISPIRQRVGSDRYMEAVPLSDLRAWVKKNGNDQTRLLQALGLVGRYPLWRDDMAWKVTIFDVRADWLCRPIRGGTPGETIQGVVVCHERLQRGGRRFTGCGYTLDTLTGNKGFDHYRVPWRDAATWGFCVMPLERLLEGS